MYVALAMVVVQTNSSPSLQEPWAGSVNEPTAVTEKLRGCDNSLITRGVDVFFTLSTQSIFIL